MALAQTDLPELKRFTFFVSRRFEEGRERFRLHMGYFATLAEAEEWLAVVREIYPGAWAGEAPGRKLRERATAAAADQARHAAGPQTRVPPPAARGAGAAAVAAPAARMSPPRAPAPAAPAAPVARVPVVHAAQPPAARAPVPGVVPTVAPAVARSAAAPAPARAPAAAPKLPAATAPAAAARSAPAAAATPASPTKAPARAPAATAAATPAARAPGKTVKPVFEDSNVREVLAALTDASSTGETRLMKAPPAPRAAHPESSLTDTQVLRMLEARPPEGGQAPASDAPHGGIQLLKPDDTGTRRALKEALVNNAPVHFAVQLQWSVQPADLDKVPPLAIFSAYTLYTVEGSRDGRKWYGLRLGFFSDAISAKQVAHYVRSEFTSVAVVPVSPQEKARATDQDGMTQTHAAPVAARAHVTDEFKLIDDDTANMAVQALLQGKPPAGAATAGRPQPKVAVGRTVRQPAAPPGKPRGVRGAGKAGAREHRAPQSLEETLEILGASQLTIDDGNGETLNDSGVRHLRVEVQKNSPFTRLLERLSERMKKP